MNRLHRERRSPAGTAAILLAAGLAWPVAAAAADRLTGYGELRFGMSPAEAAAEIGGAQPVVEGGGVETVETAVTIAGLPALRRLRFVDDRLTSILFRWEPSAGGAKAKAACRALFERLHGQLAQRYGEPALGPHQSSEGDPGYAGTAFWAFADAASISLVVARDAGGAARCQATLNYKEPPPG